MQKNGVLQPAMKAAAAGSIPVVRVKDNRTLMRLARKKRMFFTKAVDDYLHRPVSPLAAVTKIEFTIFNCIAGSVVQLPAFG